MGTGQTYGCIVARLVGALAAAAILLTAPAHAEPPRIWDPGYRVDSPDVAGLPRLRFLTSLDFPPFNFADANRRPTGFNVELARAICAELELTDRCEIQAMPWDELEPALDGRRGEVILAGTAPSAEKRTRFGLSEPYFRFPARFVAGRAFQPGDDFAQALEGRKVAVVARSAHAAMLETHFLATEPVPVADMPAAYQALRDGEADLVFGDGVTLSFWLAAPASEQCCRFVSGPYMSNAHLGHGMVAVTRAQDQLLLDAINAALKSVEQNGVYAEIFARYFPIDPFGS
ncbi:MAG: transporter substrate-binding domain-containing protein [Phyllobacteriaceae bacterium]|nr:transporter substrate-binding domain-containing protein [Phyllobacteriaceae bacterium]